MPEALLGMFAKHWTPGRVKTRLAADLGPKRAAAVYERFVRTLVDRLSEVADQRVLAFDPPSQAAQFTFAADRGWRLEPQGDGDLGRRMERFFSAALRRGARRIVLIGSDSPSVPLQVIEQAFDLLNRNPVVLGPAEDGGYYLIGASRATPPIFQQVDWSTGEVWSQTVRLLERAEIGFARLPTWYDVDQADDLARLRRELAGNIEPRLQLLADRIQAIVEGA